MKETENVILIESNKSAKRVVVIEQNSGKEIISGWLSRFGNFFRDEYLARYDGCTHKKCECGNLFKKNSYCKTCRDKQDNEKYKKMKFKEWDGETPLVLFGTDIYFFSESDIENYLEDLDPDFDKNNLQFVICEAQYPSEIEEEYFYDILPEDFCFEDIASIELLEALEKLNKIISKHRPFSWIEGVYRTSICL